MAGFSTKPRLHCLLRGFLVPSCIMENLVHNKNFNFLFHPRTFKYNNENHIITHYCVDDSCPEEWDRYLLIDILQSSECVNETEDLLYAMENEWKRHFPKNTVVKLCGTGQSAFLIISLPDEFVPDFSENALGEVFSEAGQYAEKLEKL
eukprot:TRINITY_DN66518_c8_g2_i4.p1 TRINITY_DN66518_c8_g2~~TRINITY_DN66518_c8_g2_i4.p1  ORF type:complete len:149 (-),score=3.11 TRINITY_DN66518_c8_g2_i4:92-538(-)